MTNEQLKNRTKQFSLSILNLIEKMPNSMSTRVVINQIAKSATSVGANYRAVCRARSENEKFAKLCIVVEEADETLFWLEILVECEIISQETINEVYSEGLEILKVMSSYKDKLNPKNK